jgi:hypothetical protein
MTEGAQWNKTPQAESNLQKMARGTTQETDAEWNMPQATQGPPNSKSTQEDIGEDTHQLVEGKMNEGISEMTEDTGARGRTLACPTQNERDGKRDVRGGLKRHFFTSLADEPEDEGQLGFRF